MGTAELLALSLGLSLLVAGGAYGLVRLFEPTAPDPVLREKAWAAALHLSVLPVVVVAIAFLLPPRVVENPAGPEVAGTPAAIEFFIQQGPPAAPVGRPLALAALGLAGLLAFARMVRLTRRSGRLNRLIRASNEATPELRRVVEDAARRLGAPMPDVRVRTDEGEALIAGVFRPVLILPAGLVDGADPDALRAVCAHELAHLKRGDHRALWVEEALLTVLAFNPVLRLIRDHRSAAREEACDAAALAQAGDDARRHYARSLLDALRASPRGDDAPALTFTSSRRTLVMRRLKAILSPVPTSGVRQRLTVLGLGVAVTAVVGGTSCALAAHREAEVVSPPAPARVESPAFPAASPPVPVTPAAPVAAPAVRAEPAPRSAPTPAPTPVAPPEVITNPSWVQHPMPSYPTAALDQGLTSGSVDLSCTVQGDGRVSGCTVLGEDPVGAGYGAAAVEAAGRARLSPRSVDAAGAGGTVRFTVRFRISTE